MFKNRSANSAVLSDGNTPQGLFPKTLECMQINVLPYVIFDLFTLLLSSDLKSMSLLVLALLNLVLTFASS